MAKARKLSKTAPKSDAAANERDEPGNGAPFPIVGIGASAGGLEAFTQLLKALPLDTGMGFVLVQHLDPEHESALTQILARATKLPVREITNDQTVQANHVYVIPRDTNLSIAQGALKLQPRERTRMPHRPIDAFFESLAQDQHERAIGVVLSGTASDGTLGLEAIKAEGGITFAQDDSAKHDSMPRSAIAAGCVDLVLAPADIAKELARIAKHPYGAGQPLELSMRAEEDRAQATAHADDQTPLPSGGRGAPPTQARKARAEAARDVGEGAESQAAKVAEDGYKKILLALRNHSGVDFSLYKSSTIQRRIGRRLVLSKQNTLDEYARFLRGNAKELDALYSDVLISVTSFFRNPEMFDVLQREVLPALLKQRTDDPIRVWVLGCSTGQEAYSIAISFVEAAEKAARTRKLQVFATDLNDTLLDKARHGLYAKSLADDLTLERLRRFFIEEEGGYRISKMLREMVVFARQNLISDPPFSRMDLISCRNLLIYLEPSLQKKALPTFHYALKPDGFLLLGASESIGGFTDLFAPVDRKHKIYSKKHAPTPPLHLPPRNEYRKQTSPDPRPLLPLKQPQALEAFAGLRGELNAQHEADRITVNQFAPPGVLISAELQVLQFRGPTGAYLEPPTGKASFDVLKMARDGLMLPLRAAINEAKKGNKTARRDDVPVKQNGKTRSVNLQVMPLKNLRERCFLILFEEAEKAERARSAGRAEPPARVAALSARQESKRIAELETDLSETRDYLQSMQEEHEAANEELQAANEEVQSANEELQSVNEELETSKEELESANEELTTVNEEMSNRNVELNRLNNDLVNLHASAKLPIVLLGRDLTIRRFSPQAEKQFDLLATDVGRPIGHIRHNLVLVDAVESTESPLDLESLCAEVIADVHEQALEVRDKADCWHSLRVRPYMTLDNKVDGAVLVLVGVDTLKRSEQALAESELQLRFVMDSMPQKIFTATRNGDVDYFNPQWTEFTGLSFEQIKGWGWKQFIHPDDLAETVRVWQHSLDTADPFLLEHRFRRADGEYRWHLSRAVPLRDAEGKVAMWIGSNTDIHEQKQTANQLRQYAADLSESDHRKNEFLAMLAHELRNPLAPISNALQILRLTGGDGKAVQSASEMMERQVGQMVRLVDDLVDVSRISRGKIELRRERVELASIVDQAVEAARSLVQCMEHDLTVTLPPQPIYLNADPTRLAQVVGNLLNNACKFTDNGGRIALTVEREGEQAVIHLRDNGIGIAADRLPRIFDMFVQVDTSLERSASGLGIGLSLVKNLVEMHDGTVEARSAGLGQGSEFVVRLPIMVETLELWTEPPVREPPTTTARRILVVDDNRDAAQSLARLLQLTGNETHIAYDGLEAVEAAATFRPDVVLLDIGLPKLNGYEVVRKMREQPWGKSMVLVAVTGWGQDEDRQKSGKAGFDGHMVKPIDHDALTKMLAEFLPVESS